MIENIKEYLTVYDFAKIFGYHPEHVRRLIRKGELDAIKLKQWRISPEAIERFIQSRSTANHGEKIKSNISL